MPEVLPRPEPTPRPTRFLYWVDPFAGRRLDSVIGAFFRRLHLNPFADPAEGRDAPLKIEQAQIGALPSVTHGWQVTLAICLFVASFAVGPGVCVWLALSELMPTRIRSNGMSIALLVNQFVSTTIAAVFLPTVGRHGYAAMFFFWAKQKTN